jgi:hypothetical protein
LKRNDKKLLLQQVPMFTKLEALRKKPKHVRDRYAFWFASLATFCIAGVWATTLPAKFSTIMGVDVTTPVEVAEANSRWSDMLASVRAGISGLVSDEEATTTVKAEATSSAPAMVWTEAAVSERVETDAPARIILIGTSSAAAATTSGTTSTVKNVLQ